jgi:cytochrome c553
VHAIPNTGQQSGYVIKALNEYTSGARPPGPARIMPSIAQRLSADDKRNLASYGQGLR